MLLHPPTAPEKSGFSNLPYDAAAKISSVLSPVLCPLQKTLARSVSFDGEGVHNGEHVTMTLHPAEANSGIVFERLDVKGRDSRIQARWDNVRVTPLCTQVLNRDGIEARTIEHILAALFALGISNARIALTGAEVPIMDGSSLPFLGQIRAAGTVDCEASRLFLEILRPVEVRHGNAWARMLPSSTPRFTVKVEYPQHNVGEQEASIDFSEDDFADGIAAARTFGFRSDLEYLHANGLALGGNFSNAILISEKGTIVNPGGWRMVDELARHKLLDAVGDFALANAVILGHIESSRSGHALNNSLLRALYADESAFMRRQGSDTQAPAENAVSGHISA